MNKRLFAHKQEIIATTALFIVAYAVYSPVLNTPLIGDDFAWCWRGLDRSGSLLGSLYDYLNTILPLQFRPVPAVSWWAQCNAFGQAGLPSHLFGVSLHAVNATLLGLFLLKAGISRYAAYAAALLFVLMPIAPEVVTYSSGRVDLTGIFFTLLALVSYMHFARTGSRRGYWASVAAFSAALLSKEQFVILTALVPLLEVFFGGCLLRQGEPICADLSNKLLTITKRMLPFVAASAIYVILMRLTMDSIGGVNSYYLSFFWPRLSGIATTIDTLVAPFSAFEFSRLTIKIMGAYVALLLIVSTWLIFRSKKSTPDDKRLFTFTMVLILLAPMPTYITSLVVGIGQEMKDTHLLFISSMGLIVVIGLGFDLALRIERLRLWAVASVLLLMVVSAWGLIQNNRAWEENAILGVSISEKTMELLPQPPAGARIYYLGLRQPDGAWAYTTWEYQLYFQYDRDDFHVTKIKAEDIPVLGPDEYLFTFNEDTGLLTLETPDGRQVSARV